MYIDTHTHLYDEKYKDRQEMIQRAVNAGVSKLIMPNCDTDTIAPMLETEDRNPGLCYSMMGLHPCYVDEKYRNQLAIMKDWFARRKFVAVGEIGLDYYWDKTFVDQQKEAFATQIDWALEYNLPIVIHSRDSIQDSIDIVRQKQNGKLKGIFHCYSGNVKEAKQITELGLSLGIGGVVTYKKSSLPDVVQAIDLQYIVLETDAPYLAPVPYRGKPNESGYLPYIAEKIGDIKGMSAETIGKITAENTIKIFGELN